MTATGRGGGGYRARGSDLLIEMHDLPGLLSRGREINGYSKPGHRVCIMALVPRG